MSWLHIGFIRVPLPPPPFLQRFCYDFNNFKGGGEEGCNSKRFGAFVKLELRRRRRRRLCFSVDEDLWDQDYEIILG